MGDGSGAADCLVGKLDHDGFGHVISCAEQFAFARQKRARQDQEVAPSAGAAVESCICE